MPVYVPEDYRVVKGHVLNVLKIEIRVMEVAASGQRFATLEACGNGGSVYTTAAMLPGMLTERIVQELIDNVLWQSVLTDIPF